MDEEKDLLDDVRRCRATWAAVQALLVDVIRMHKEELLSDGAWGVTLGMW